MRLIDADELKKHIRRCDDSATRVTFDFVDEDDIDDAPTVDVLEQIKAEIVEEQSCWREDADAEWYECRRILRIIDKYKAERG